MQPIEIELLVKPEKLMTGIHRYASSLETYLRKAGVNVNVVYPRFPRWLKVLTWPLAVIGFDPQAFFAGYPVNANIRPDCIHHLTADSLASILLFQRLNPVIITIQGLYGYVYRNDPLLTAYRHFPEEFFDLLSIQALKKADAIIAVSEFLKGILINQIGIQPSKVHVVPEGVDHTIFRPYTPPDEHWNHYQLQRDRRYIIYVGSEKPGKNFRILLQAFARLKRQPRYEALHLLKVGQPEMTSQRTIHLQMIRQLDIENDVTFIDHVGNELPFFYNIAEVFVFPSIHEGFGLPPLEAMACGLPVVCSNAGALPEVVGDAALMFEPHDENLLVRHLDSLLSNAALRTEYSKRGLAQASHFDWDLTARRTIEIYSSVAPPLWKTSPS